jgi:hypothetical protein
MTALATDLTTLANLKGYLPNAGNMADQTLQRILSAASISIERYLARDLVAKTYTKTFDGNNGPRMVLPDYPINSVTAVSIYGAVIPTGGQYTATLGAKPGFFNTDKTVELIGYSFCKGKANVNITYSAGFETLAEAQSVPATIPYTVTPLQPNGAWVSDQGVSYATSGQLTAVTGTPAQGQYSVSVGVGGLPQYNFNSADASEAMLFNYGYVPPDLEQACIMLVQFWLAERTRPGEASRSMGGQNISFITKSGLPESVKQMIDQYKRTFPV